MEIWNSRSLDNNQRFIYALIAGFVSAVLLGIAYGIIYGFLRVQSAVLYLFVGWCIGYVIRYTGHGVHNRFAVAGACFTLLAIIIGDTIAMCGGLSGIPMLLKNPGMWGTLLENWLRIYLSTNLSSILGLAMRALGVYMGYHYSVIL
jgi:hypothetical protein